MSVAARVAWFQLLVMGGGGAPVEIIYDVDGRDVFESIANLPVWTSNEIPMVWTSPVMLPVLTSKETLAVLTSAPRLPVFTSED